MSPSAEEIIKLFDLKPHPEGGYYSETYRAKGIIPHHTLPKGFKGDRNFSTAIYYLLMEGQQSKLHRLASDELFHFYLGDPLTVVMIFPDRVEKVVMGQEIAKGQRLQWTIPAGCWFGGYLSPGSRFSLIGCTVAPGFDFADFDANPNQDKLMRAFPHAREEILRFT